MQPEAVRFATMRALSVGIGLAFASCSAHAADAAMPQGSTTWTVDNCDDDGPGSLREALSMAADGDSVDLTTLTCSTITLTSGQLATAVDDIQLFGNGVAIDAAGSNRVLYHTGAGTLDASHIDFINGFASGAAGGCINSGGSVELYDVEVRGCLASGPRYISGGGVFARGSIHVNRSTIADNTAVLAGGAYYDAAQGAGLAAFGPIEVLSSTISGNSVVSNSIYSSGGGFWSGTGVTIDHSTISGNRAFIAGAGTIESLPGTSMSSDIVDSTISGNTATFRNAGIQSFGQVLRIRSSTIAFNSAATGLCGGGLVTFGFQNFLYLGSSIIAENTAGGVPDDLCWQGDRGGGVIGANNLIIAAWLGNEPADTINADPLLAPLADNGGPTMTHALLPGSPALDRGNNAAFLATDQRGADRVSGVRADIGAFEQHQSPPPDPIFSNGFDAPG